MNPWVELFASNLRAKAVEGRTALVNDQTSIGYDELVRKAGSLAVYFSKLGAPKGARISVELNNSIEFILCYIACIIGGQNIVPINPSLPLRDKEYILEASRPDLSITSKDKLDFSHSHLDDFLSEDNSLGSIFFTSGTTARPKGVCHSIASMIHNAHAFNELVGIDADVRMLHIMPMGYMAGFLNTVLSPLMAGGTVIVAPQFSAAGALGFWEPAIRHGATSVWITPTMAALLARLNRDPSSPKWTKENLKHVFVGTAALPGPTARKFLDTFGVPCLESYGMSEVMLVSASLPGGNARQGTTGPLLDGVEVVAHDAEGRELPPGKDGNLFIRSHYSMLGYLDPETSEPDIVEKGQWFSTGDTGHIDSKGHLVISGRKKDIIIHGGVNISPFTVEEVLLCHPMVTDAAAIGRAHQFWGEEVVAFIVIKEGESIDMQSLKKYCTENLNPDAVPAEIRLVDELPRSSTGKVQKNVLREMT